MPEVVNRWLGYLGMALLCGGFAFFGLVLRPTLDRPAADRQERDSPAQPSVIQTGQEESAFSPLLHTVPAAGWGLSILTIVVGSLLQAASSTGGGTWAALGSSLLTLLSSTRYGVLFWLRLSLLILAGVLLAVGWRKARHGGTVSSRWWQAGLGLAVLALLTMSLGSHAAAGLDPTLAIIADWLHLTAASIWAGGLALLLITLPLVSRMKTVGRAVLPRLIAHFSQVAILCVVVLGATGVYRAITEVGGWQNLTNTQYGVALLVKLALLAPVMGLAAANLLLLRRKVEEACDPLEPKAAFLPWYRRIRQAVGGEVLLVCAILLATGVLTSLPTGHYTLAFQPMVQGRAADLQLGLVVSPGRPGPNTVEVYIQDSASRLVTNAEKVALIVSFADQDVGENEVVTDNLGNGAILFRRRTWP